MGLKLNDAEVNEMIRVGSSDLEAAICLHLAKTLGQSVSLQGKGLLVLRYGAKFKIIFVGTGNEDFRNATEMPVLSYNPLVAVEDFAAHDLPSSASAAGRRRTSGPGRGASWPRPARGPRRSSWCGRRCRWRAGGRGCTAGGS